MLPTNVYIQLNYWWVWQMYTLEDVLVNTDVMKKLTGGYKLKGKLQEEIKTLEEER